VQVIRSGEGPRLRSEQGDFVGTLLSAGSKHARRDVYVIELADGVVREAQAHTPGSVEHVVVAAGRMRAGPVGSPVDLGPGDYAAFAGDLPHRYEALAPATWAVLVMEHP
jgi:quercetin dioxygenase-like cupin family protein